MKKWWKDPVKRLEVGKKISKSNTKINHNSNVVDYKSLIYAYRQSHEYGMWRRFVLKTYNYTCSVCGYKTYKHTRLKKIEAHHIYPLGRIFKEEKISCLSDARKNKRLNDTSNGTILCLKCHRDHHKNNPVENCFYEIANV